MSRTRSSLDAEAVAELFAAAEAEVTEGRLPACSVAVACDSALEVATFGAPAEARFMVFSLTKSLIAGAMWVLFGEGVLAPSSRVAEFIPGFGSFGKDAVTVEHLLTHTAGFPSAPLRPEDGADPARRVERFAEWQLEWEPGTQTSYHPTSAHWVLAELIERVGGMNYRAFVHSRVLDPLGLTRWRLGVPVGEQADILDVVIVGGAHDVDVPKETGSEFVVRFNDPAVRAIGVPGAGAAGNASDIALYFQALLRRDDRVWDPAVVADATSVIRNRHADPPTGIPANRTLGLKVAGDDGKAWMREVGHGAGPRTFVNSAVAGQVAWADPDTGLSFCFLTNGCDDDVVRSFFRSSELSTLAAKCAGG